MARRKAKNKTGLPRIKGIGYHDAWVGFVCLACGRFNSLCIGKQLLDPLFAHDNSKWKCRHCGYMHSKYSDLPFKNWHLHFKNANSIKAQRFWEAFFRIATEHPESYWKQCNTCGRILPFAAFSKHKNWGALERQMECRSCKGAINAVLNPKRTHQQLYESSIRRRVADLFVKSENRNINIKDLFIRFEGRCFKTKRILDINKRNTWAIDHILPSKWLYPLNRENAALLCKEANNNKGELWPSQFYTNSELIILSKITGAELGILASKTPIVNPGIDVNNCVANYLKVREHSNLKKRVTELKQILTKYELTSKLSFKNKKLLGI